VRAVQITRFGGPDVLTLTDLPEPEPRDGLARIEVTAAGINFADTHQSENTYLSPQTLPMVPGAEVVGRTDTGQRVVALVDGGGYAEVALASPGTTFPLPDGVSDGQALSLVLQGTTAWHILRTCAHVAEGESVVVQAAAGGVGSLAVQLAKFMGAGRVIAVASSPEKRALAMELGADVAVEADPEGMTGRLKEANGGRSVDVVLEMVGGRVFDESLAALAPFGRLVTYGMASRTPETPVTSNALMTRSRAVVGFWLAHCFRRTGMLSGPMDTLLAMVTDGRLSPVVGATYPMSEVRRAHEDLLARRTTGKLVLDPRR
jgi:NADPH:quinone reductase